MNCYIGYRIYVLLNQHVYLTVFEDTLVHLAYI